MFGRDFRKRKLLLSFELIEYYCNLNSRCFFCQQYTVVVQRIRYSRIVQPPLWSRDLLIYWEFVQVLQSRVYSENKKKIPVP